MLFQNSSWYSEHVVAAAAAEMTKEIQDEEEESLVVVVVGGDCCCCCRAMACFCACSMASITPSKHNKETILFCIKHFPKATHSTCKAVHHLIVALAIMIQTKPLQQHEAAAANNNNLNDSIDAAKNETIINQWSPRPSLMPLSKMHMTMAPSQPPYDYNDIAQTNKQSNSGTAIIEQY